MPEIWILLGYSRYDTLLHFSLKFNEALQRHGIKTKLIHLDKSKIQDLINDITAAPKPILCCSFDDLRKYVGYEFFWDKYRIPFWHITVDNSWMKFNYCQSSYAILSCVDRLCCDDLKSLNFDRAFFWGHGVERELSPEDKQERPFDVVYLGTCYDTDGLESLIKKLPEDQHQVLNKAIEIYSSTSLVSEYQALLLACEECKVFITDKTHLLYLLDNYIKGYDRLELIRSIKNAKVHIFGGATNRPQKVKGWADYFSRSPNVIVHPAVPIQEGIEIMKKSKICLNSMPFFKDGTHIRLFMGPACGCLMVSTDTLYTRKRFADRQDMILYKPGQYDSVNEKVCHYLAHENERRVAAEKARAKVMENDTWDHRVQEMMKKMPDILKVLK